MNKDIKINAMKTIIRRLSKKSLDLGGILQKNIYKQIIKPVSQSDR